MVFMVDVLQNVTGDSILSHLANVHTVAPGSAAPSMVSHTVTCFNSVHTSTVTMEAKEASDVPKKAEYGEPGFNLWQHLVDIHCTSFSKSFSRAAKRMRECEEDEDLCDRIGALQIAQDQSMPLDLSFKKLCISNAGQFSRKSTCFARNEEKTGRDDESFGSNEDNQGRDDDKFGKPHGLEFTARTSNGNGIGVPSSVLTEVDETLPGVVVVENGETIHVDVQSCTSVHNAGDVFPAVSY